jgi:hypothetical protein
MKLFIGTLLGLALTIGSSTALSQDYVPGESYLDDNGYVEFLPGNLPIILSSPHGGYLEPDSIPNRDCDGCVYGRDGYTQELTVELREEIYDKTGCYPYVIINLLHRKKFDANRSIETAADGNLYVEESWAAYHEFIEIAKTMAVADYNRALFIDMHGHAHVIERIELGYLFTKSELQLTDAELNTADLIDETAIKQLVEDNNGVLSCAELVRGDLSLGTLLHEQGFPSVPSTAIPAPIGEELYFNGGYNTVQHGSKYGGLVDAIQLEFNSDVRWVEDLRLALADSLAVSLIQYMDAHYFPSFATHFCLLPELSIDKESIDEIQIYPNPANDQILLTTEERGLIRLYNIAGAQVLVEIWNGNPISISGIEQGVYTLQFENELGQLFYSKFMKE